MLFASQKWWPRGTALPPPLRCAEGVKNGEMIKKNKGLLLCSCHPASFKRASNGDIPCRGAPGTAIPAPSLTSSISARAGATAGDTVTRKATVEVAGGQPGRELGVVGPVAGMQTNSGSKVQAVPGADGRADSSLGARATAAARPH